MSGIIEHQLKRAAASGGALLGQAPVEVAQVASELRGTLLKVYAGKDLSLELAIAPAALFVGDRGDLTELLGNLQLREVAAITDEQRRGRDRKSTRLNSSHLVISYA